MAGNQASAMAVGSHCARKNVSVEGFERYDVKSHSTPPSPSYFNKVKAWMKEHMAFETKQWEKKFGEKEWWKIVHIEMTDYTFGFESNQAMYLYHKYKGELDATQAKPRGEVRGKIRYKQADS